jgi:2-polyprenyl-6-methoxyphenol hydroxylase-like FAD-dependent oxidoreductase
MNEIAIIGGGVGGLTLARILQVNGIAATLYERDSSSDVRRLGGQLDLRERDGQYALRAAGLIDEFRARSRPEGDAVKLYDKRGTCLLDDTADDQTGGHPEISRVALRDMLVESLDQTSIVWGRKATGVQFGDGRPEVLFSDGSTVAADLVVGADGAWSAVRPALSSAQPQYTGIANVELIIHDAPVSHPESVEFVGAGTMCCFADGQGVITQLNGDGTIRIYASIREDSHWLDELAEQNIEQVKADLRERFDGWTPQILRLFSEASGHFMCRPIFALPVQHEWERVPGVTLLGDAAHLMSPFAGHGANLALLDAAELAASITEHVGDLERALTVYESALFPRSAEHAAETASNLDLFHGPDAAAGLVGMFTDMRATA